jgi:hypothetical protein
VIPSRHPLAASTGPVGPDRPRGPLRRSWLAIPALVVAAGAAGCGDEAAIRPGDIRTYAAPRPEPSALASSARGPESAAPASPAPRLRYEVPDGWTDAGASGMRLATVTIGAPAEGREVTVIPASGSLRANVERWQGQLGSEADAATAAVDRALAEAETLDVDGTRATVVLLLDEAAAAAGDGQAILGAMVPVDDSSALFVKFKGDAAIARRERENFTRFVSSLRWN